MRVRRYCAPSSVPAQQPTANKQRLHSHAKQKGFSVAAAGQDVARSRAVRRVRARGVCRADAGRPAAGGGGGGGRAGEDGCAEAPARRGVAQRAADGPRAAAAGPPPRRRLTEAAGGDRAAAGEPACGVV